MVCARPRAGLGGLDWHAEALSRSGSTTELYAEGSARAGLRVIASNSSRLRWFEVDPLDSSRINLSSLWIRKIVRNFVCALMPEDKAFSTWSANAVQAQLYLLP